MGPRGFTFLASLMSLAIFAGLNIAAQNWLSPARLDMTQNHLYTLSDAAREVTQDLSEPVELELVYSRQLAAEFPDIRAYGARVRELLTEISARSNGNVRIVETDPAPFTPDEDRITDAGLESAPTAKGDPLYFGIIGRNSVDDQIIIPFLEPQREALLEYDLVKLISQLDDPTPPRVGIITDLRSLTGYGRNARDPYILREMARSFEIEQIPENFQVLPRDLDAIMIIHPPELTLRQQYELDQFILRGGHALIALDPASRSVLTSRGRRTRLSSGLGEVETTLGLLPLHDVVIDREIGLPVERIENGRRIVEAQPLFIAPPPANMSKTDPVTTELSRSINFGAAGRLVATPPMEASFEPLIWTSDDAALISSQKGGRDLAPRDLLTDYAAIGESQVLAGRLSGRFTSTFTADDIPPIKIPDDPVEARLLNIPEVLPEHLATAEADAQIILVSDADLFSDEFYISPANDTPAADNAAFVLNAMDNLAGDAALVRLRSRAPSSRSMTRIDGMRDEARNRLYEEQSVLEDQLAATEARLEELKAQGAAGGFLSQSRNLDEAQAEEMARFRADAIDIRDRLRGIERAFRADIDRLEQRIVFFNMWLPPILTALLGMLVVFWRARRKGR